MIRGSIVVALIAVALSLIVHVTGLSLTAPRLVEQTTAAPPQDTVALGNEFEDIADAIEEPVEEEPEEAPEPEPEPEPEAQEEPVPEPSEVPISEALVASENPEPTPIPDVGEAEVVQPVTTEPAEPAESESETLAEADSPASDEVDTTPPVETSDQVEAPEGDPDTSETAVDTAEESEPVEAQTQELAALPDVVEAPTPEAQPVPEVPLDEGELASPQPDEVEPTEESELAVTSSIRPRLPTRTPQSARPQGLPGSNDFSALRFPRQEIESPLRRYQREGVDAFTRSDSGARSGGRGNGNSNTTNYAGRVLVHLNRAPIVYVSARGFAQVFFEINPDGTLAWVDVVDSSGSPEVDRAARAQVRAASPFPLPPDGVSRKLSFFYTSN